MFRPNCRDALSFSVDSALKEFPKSGHIDAQQSAISEQFAAHSKEIFSRGYAFQIKRGLMPAVAELKSVSGLQAFLDLAVSVYLDRRQSVSTAIEAGILWGLTSSMLSGIAAGYGTADFGGVSGRHLLAKNPRSWLPPMGFCRGVEIMSFFEEFPDAHRNVDMYRSLGAPCLRSTALRTSSTTTTSCFLV